MFLALALVLLLFSLFKLLGLVLICILDFPPDLRKLSIRTLFAVNHILNLVEFIVQI